MGRDLQVFLLRRRIRLLIVIALLLRRRKKRRRMWVRQIYRNRQIKGEQTLIPELYDDPEKFHTYFRMSVPQFEELLGLVGPRIKKITTNFRVPIPPRDRLAITLKHLAHGDSHQSLSFSYRVGHSTVGGIIEETCEAIWDVLQPTHLKFPSSVREWRKIAEEFKHKWNYPFSCGAIDGKHLPIRAPSNAGSEYYNYKGFHSIMLLAMCDANYCFTMIHVGDSGRHSDGGVFATSAFGHILKEDQLPFPPDEALPCTDLPVPYHVVGDAAYPLRRKLMRPYPGRLLPLDKKVFNYRLSRARRVIENAFGIWTTRWRLFSRTIGGYPDKVILLCKASCCLHNFLQRKSRSANPQQRVYCPDGYADEEDANGNVIPGAWRLENNCNLRSIGRLGSNSYSNEAAAVRDRLKDYFMSPQGELPWQINLVQRGT